MQPAALTTLHRLGIRLSDDPALTDALWREPARVLRDAGVDDEQTLRALADALDASRRVPPYWPLAPLTRSAARNPFSYMDATDAMPERRESENGSVTPAQALERLGRLEIPAGTATAVIVVPPWAELYWPCLSVHLLQACARAAGHEVRVLYANLMLGAVIGTAAYELVAYGPRGALLGEGVFSSVAFGLPSLTERGGDELRRELGKLDKPLSLPVIRALEEIVAAWVEAVAAAIAELDVAVVGATTGFEQTSASIAILNAVKRRRPDVVTILGGPNCEAEMVHGVASLPASVDHIFSGEAEETFVEFLDGLERGARPAARVIESPPRQDMDTIPTPTFAEYYDQRSRYVPIDPDDPGTLWLSYETARGCWWGEKHHCTFCGLNGAGMALRAKSPERVLEELGVLLDEHPCRNVWMTDNIMPFAYFRNLLPRLAEQHPGLSIYWEMKANLTLARVRALKEAGLGYMQPGIEALGTALLRRMDKGVSAGQVIALLRYNRAVELADTWNILFDFPGDELEEYEEQIEVMPLLHHLHPPTFLASVSLDRFSPHVTEPERYGIRNLRPRPAYAWTFPPGTDLDNLAYHFAGDYRTALQEHPDRLQALAGEFTRWQRAWQDGAPPTLAVSRLNGDDYVLVDTRPHCGQPRVSFIDRDRAHAALVSARVDSVGDAELEWALERKVGAVIDGGYVALATARPELLAEFEGAVV